LYDRLERGGNRKHVAGDYRGFDTSFIARLFLRIFEMIILVYKIKNRIS
jgi:hypothetical protein